MTALIGVTAAAGVDAAQPRRYQATTRLLVGAPAATAAAYALIAASDSGVRLAAEDAGVVDADPAATATAEAGVSALTVTAEADTAEAAFALASAYRASLPRIARELEPATNAPARTVDVTVLAGPVRPAGPSSPRPMRDLPIGAALGVLVALAGAFGRQAADARLHTTGDLERAVDALLIGSVPRQRRGSAVPFRRAPGSAGAQAYGRLRTTLEYCNPSGLNSALVITAATRGEGASSVAANLALVAAQSGRRVVLVDADLHRPSLARRFGVPGEAGLAEVAIGICRLDDVLVPIEGTRLTLLPSGRPPNYPSELLGSESMAEVIDELTHRYDLVLLDTPPVLAVPDALALGVHVDGVVVVARMAWTTSPAIRRAVDALRKVGAEVLGVVANAAVARDERVYGTTFRRYGAVARAAQQPSEELDLLERLTPAARRHEPCSTSSRRGRRVAATPVDQAGRPTPTPSRVGSETERPRVLELDPQLKPQPQPQPAAQPQAHSIALPPSIALPQPHPVALPQRHPAADAGRPRVVQLPPVWPVPPVGSEPLAGTVPQQDQMPSVVWLPPVGQLLPVVELPSAPPSAVPPVDQAGVAGRPVGSPTTRALILEPALPLSPPEARPPVALLAPPIPRVLPVPPALPEPLTPPDLPPGATQELPVVPPA